MEEESSRSEREDRISDLPEDIRHLILSYLPYHSAVTTSLLWRSWRYNWLNSYSLNIDRSFFEFWKSYDERRLSKSLDNIVSTPSCRYLAFLYFILTQRMSNANHGCDPRMIPNLELDLSSLLFEYWPPTMYVTITSFLEYFNVQNLVISINKNQVCYDELMQFLLSTKSLTELRVASIGISHPYTRTIRGVVGSSSPCLRKLSLYKVVFDEPVVDKLFVNNTFVESLTIDRCCGLEHLKLQGLSKLKELRLSSPSVKRLEIHGAPNFRSLYYDAYGMSPLVIFNNDTLSNQMLLRYMIRCVVLQLPCLKELEIRRCEDYLVEDESCVSHLQKLSIFGRSLMKMNNTKLDYCKDLTYLKLVDCKLVDDLLNRALSTLTKLEVLEIKSCNKLNHVKVSLKHLRTLYFIDCENLELVELDCPNLSNFKCKTCYDQPVCVLRGSSISTPTHVDVYVKEIMLLYQYYQLLATLVKLRDLQYQPLFRKFEDSTIQRPRKKGGKRCFPLFKVEHLKLTVVEDITTKPLIELLLDNILWLCPHIKRIQFTSLNEHKTRRCNPVNIIIRFDYKEPTSLREKGGCYTNVINLPVNCWRHSVKSIVIEERQGLEYDGPMGEFWSNVVSGWNKKLSNKTNSHCEKSKYKISTIQQSVAALTDGDNEVWVSKTNSHIGQRSDALRLKRHKLSEAITKAYNEHSESISDSEKLAAMNSKKNLAATTNAAFDGRRFTMLGIALIFIGFFIMVFFMIYLFFQNR